MLHKLSQLNWKSKKPLVLVKEKRQRDSDVDPLGTPTVIQEALVSISGNSNKLKAVERVCTLVVLLAHGNFPKIKE